MARNYEEASATRRARLPVEARATGPSWERPTGSLFRCWSGGSSSA